MEDFTMSVLLEQAGSVFTQLIAWAGTVGSPIVGNPLMLVPYIIGFGFAGVGLFKTLTRR